MALTRDQLIAAAESSPQAAATHDRAGWVRLFAEGAQVEDPVGSRPHTGAVQIAEFYDTFIGPRDITFHRDADVVEDATVIRDLELEVAMGDTVIMRIPAYLRYRMTPDLRIAHLQAFWELPSMVAQFARNGLAAGPAGVGLAAALMRNQGPVGALGFARGFRRAGRRARNRFVALLDTLSAGDEVALRRQLSHDTAIYRGDAEPMSSAGLLALTSGGTWRKPIMSGHTLVAGLRGEDSVGVLIVDFVPRALSVRRIRFYADRTR